MYLVSLILGFASKTNHVSVFRNCLDAYLKYLAYGICFAAI